MREFRRAEEKRRKKALKKAGKMAPQCRRAPQPVSAQRSQSSHFFYWSDEAADFNRAMLEIQAREVKRSARKHLAAALGVAATALIMWWLHGL